MLALLILFVNEKKGNQLAEVVSSWNIAYVLISTITYSVMFCIFIHNIYNLCLLHLWKRRQCEACRGCKLSVGSLIYFCDWCLSNHLKHAFTKFYIFLITRNKKVDVILIFKSLYNYLICQEKYILFKLTWMHRGMILIWNHFYLISKNCDLLQLWILHYDIDLHIT